jgi:hypothetical protein
MPDIHTINLPNGVMYEIDDENLKVKSVFPDGSELIGIASLEEDDVNRARALGYMDAWQMHRHHDLLHHIVCQAMGWPYSIVLWMIANNLSIPPGIGNIEERIVFLVTRALNLQSASPLSLISQES